MTDNEAFTILNYEIKRRPEDELIREAMSLAVSAFEEVKEYRAIGTIRACQEAMEKQKAKKPIEQNLREFKVICPKCSGLIESHASNIYCYYCGQAIDWSDTDYIS